MPPNTCCHPPQKLRGYRNKPGGFLASPSPIKKRCRPGSAPFCDLSACCITSTHPSTGETPLNRSSLTTTTTCETDEDEWGDDDEWADTDSTATTGGAARGSLGSIGEDAGELNIHQRHCIMDAPRPPPTPIHSHHHHTQQHQQHYQLHGNQRRLWSTPGACILPFLKTYLCMTAAIGVLVLTGGACPRLSV